MTDERPSSPWLVIPAEDYEGHMAHEEVGQLPALAELFGEALAERAPRRVLVLGVASGNGLEHVDPAVTERVVGVDLNAEYLALARERHGSRLPGLELIEADAMEIELDDSGFDLISAALFLEYVDWAAMLPKIAGWLAPGGALDLVLQMPSVVSGMVTPTGHDTVMKLAPHMRLVPPEPLRRAAADLGLEPEGERRLLTLPGPKAFHVERLVKR